MQFLRWPEVQAIVGLSRTTVWRLERRGAFPGRCRISENAVGWLDDEISEWVRRQASSRNVGASGHRASTLPAQRAV